MSTKAPENTATTSDLTDAQIAALDRDGNGEAGGSLPKVGAVTKKGKPAPTAAELGSDLSQLVSVRITGRGDKRVHDGQGGRYDAGDEVFLPLGVALDLRGDANDRNALGYVEILGKA
jgi:hypothetical protein